MRDKQNIFYIVAIGGDRFERADLKLTFNGAQFFCDRQTVRC